MGCVSGILRYLQNLDGGYRSHIRGARLYMLYALIRLSLQIPLHFIFKIWDSSTVFLDMVASIATILLHFGLMKFFARAIRLC